MIIKQGYDILDTNNYENVIFDMDELMCQIDGTSEIIYADESVIIISCWGGGEVSILANSCDPFSPSGMGIKNPKKALKAYKEWKKATGYSGHFFPCTDWGKRLEKIIQKKEVI